MEQEVRENPKGKTLNFLERGFGTLTLIVEYIFCPLDGNRQLPTEASPITTGSLYLRFLPFIWATLFKGIVYSDLCCLELCGEMSETCTMCFLCLNRHCRGVVCSVIQTPREAHQ